MKIPVLSYSENHSETLFRDPATAGLTHNSDRKPLPVILNYHPENPCERSYLAHFSLYPTRESVKEVI
jgi:hypothetical protein